MPFRRKVHGQSGESLQLSQVSIEYVAFAAHYCVFSVGRFFETELQISTARTFCRKHILYDELGDSG